MADSLDIKVVQDASHAPGHVVLRVSGVDRAPLDESFVIRRVGDHAAAFESDWPTGPRTPLASEWRAERRELDLLVGPEVVNPIPGGTPVVVQLPGLGNRELFLTWPDGLMLAASRNPRRGRGRRDVAVPVATSDESSRPTGIERRRVAEERAQRESGEHERLAQEQQQREAAERQRQEQEHRQREIEERRRAAEELDRRRVAERERREREEAERQRHDLERQQRQRDEELERTRAEEAARRQRDEEQQRAEEARRRAAAAAQPAPPAAPRGRVGLVVGLMLVAAVAIAAVAILPSLLRKEPPREAPAALADAPPARQPPAPSCGDPHNDYDLAMEKFFDSPPEAERLLRCVIQGSDTTLADKARRQLDTLEHRKKR